MLNATLVFLTVIDKALPPHVEVHLILDNYGTHKTELIRKWLLKHPRHHLHFTPTSASWINQVERWFAEITPADEILDSLKTYCTRISGAEH